MAKQSTGPKVQVTIPLGDRWEEGIEHDARSQEIYGFISDYDWKFNGDALGLSAGGDGDNGEELMYLLDEYFAAKDSLTPQLEPPIDSDHEQSQAAIARKSWMRS